MKIVAVTPRYPPGSLVGAWVSTHECLKYFASRGHDVRAHTTLQAFEPPYELDGVPVSDIPRSATGWGDLVRSADVLITHLGDNQAAERVAQKYGVPSVRMAHGGAVTPERCDGAALVVWNSQAFKNEINWGGPSIIVPPPVWADQYVTTPGDRVTLVNCSEAKGVMTMWKVAERLSHVEFLAVKGHYGEQIVPRADNVEVVEPERDPRSIYSRTRVLLMPSRRETWGRVGIEAMASGIPVIAHPTDGLRESLAEAGMFVHRDDIDGWTRQVERLLEPSAWGVASRMAKKRSEELDPSVHLDHLAAAIERLVPACV